MKLNNQNIATVIENIENFFDAVKISKKDKLKLCLILEESLLRYQEKFGEDCEFKILMRKWFGTPKVLIKIKGVPYNPLEHDDEQIFSASVMQNLLNYEQAGVTYRYENGCNEINAFSTREIKRLKIPGGVTTLSVLLGIAAAFIAENFSLQTQKILIENITTPMLNSLLGAVVAVNIPLIFISIVASVCSIENVTTLNNLGSKVFKRFLAISLFIIVVTMFISIVFFPVIDFNFGGQIFSSDSQEIQKIFVLILSIIPQNVVDPFLKGQILQVVVLAMLTGVSITILGDRVSDLKNVIMNLKLIIFKIVALVMKIIPLVIFLCIFKTILVYSFDEIFGMWKILAANYLAFFIIPAAMLVKVAIKYDVKISDFMKKIYPACLISFTTGSSSASIPKNLEICKKELKINETLCDFYIPLSHALLPTSMLIGIIIYVFYAAEFSDIQISIAQLIIIAFLSWQFSISAVGENGGMIAIMTLMLTQLGFPMDSLGIIMTANVFLVNISGVIGIIIRDCDLYDFSHEVNLTT